MKDIVYYDMTGEFRSSVCMCLRPHPGDYVGELQEIQSIHLVPRQTLGAFDVEAEAIGCTGERRGL